MKDKILKNRKVKSNSIALSDYPLVSIGMPVYNSELTVDKAIESVISQDYKNIELIISDNASSDETSKMSELFVVFSFDADVFIVPKAYFPSFEI